MPMNRIQRGAAIVAAAGAIAAASTGVTYATASSASVYACTNSHSTLRLLSAHGKCAHGYHKVRVSRHAATGKRGATGAKGATGVKGAAGSPGTGPITLNAETTSASTGPSIVKQAVPGLGLTASSVCAANGSEIVLEDTTGAGDYDAHGRSFFSGLGSNGQALVAADGKIQTMPAGPTNLDYRQPAGEGDASSIFVQAGQLAGQLLVTRNGKSMTLDFFLLSITNHCLAQMQVTPTS